VSVTGFILKFLFTLFRIALNSTVLDAVCSQITLGRKLFEVGIERGFYAKVSRLGEQWFELDLHFLSLGGGEIALGWWFEECLVPYLTDTEKLASVKSISIVTGYGKTRTRGRRNGDDGMRKRCRAMLQFMGVVEQEQPNLGRIHIDKESLIELVNKNGGKILFDLEGYTKWKEEETALNALPDIEQKIRARFKPTATGSGGPPFTRVESEFTSNEYRLENHDLRMAKLREHDMRDNNESSRNADYYGNEGDNVGYGDPRGSGNWGLDSSPSKFASHVAGHRRQRHDQPVVPNQHGTSQFRSGNDGDRDIDLDFHRNVRPKGDFNHQGINSIGHQPYDEWSGSKESTLRRHDDFREDDQQGNFYKVGQHGFRQERRDAYIANQHVPGYFGDGHVDGISQTLHSVVNNVDPNRRFSEEYAERPMHQHNFPSDGRGTRQVLPRDSGHFNGTAGDMAVADDPRGHAHDRGFQGARGSSRKEDFPINRQNPHISMSEIDRTEPSNSAYERAYSEGISRSYGRHNDSGEGGDAFYREGRHNQQYPSSIATQDGTFEGNRHQDKRAQNIGQEAVRKRLHNEAEQPIWNDDHLSREDGIGTQRQFPSNNRGYALEPEIQRRRLS
jgi:hypothetical protein